MEAQGTHETGKPTQTWRKAGLLFAVMKEVRNWPTYFADYFGLVHAPLAEYRLRTGTKVRVRSKSDDRPIFNDIWLRQVYCAAQDIREGDVVIDIGAHIGLFSLFAASRGARVLAFEPFPENYALLAENVAANGMEDRISAFNLAVWESREVIKLHRSHGGTGSHSAFGSSTDAIPVKCTTLAAIFEQHHIERCRVLKIDAEGAEYPILYTAPASILSRIEMISLEWHETADGEHPSYEHLQLREFLEERGFHVESPPGLYVYRARMRDAKRLAPECASAADF